MTVGVHRPPSLNNVPEFFEILVEVLLKLTGLKNDIVLVGEINIDLLKDSKISRELIEILKNFELISQFCSPTSNSKD